jgi:SAM-dependent methyltransferase
VWRIDTHLGVPVKGMEASRRMYLNRCSPHVVNWNPVVAPWPFGDGQFDLAVSNEYLGHLAGAEAEVVAAEARRVCRRGLHTVDFEDPSADPEGWSRRLGGHRVLNARDLQEGYTRLLYNSGPVKLNCGCGQAMFYYGWYNLDKDRSLQNYSAARGYRFLLCDLRIPFDTTPNGVTAVLAEHLLDRLSPQEAADFLEECWRVLMAGGVMRIGLPDVSRLAAMREGLSFFDDLDERVGSAARWEDKLHVLAYEGRKSAYDPDSLSALLDKIGFSRIKVCRFGETCSGHVRKETYDTLARPVALRRGQEAGRCEKEATTLAQVNNTYGRNAFLPYSVGLLRAYAEKDPRSGTTTTSADTCTCERTSPRWSPGWTGRTCSASPATSGTSSTAWPWSGPSRRRSRTA